MKRFIRFLVLILVLGGLGGGGFVWWAAFRNNVTTEGEEYALLIPKDAGFEFVCDQLEADKVLKNMGTFRQVADIRSYPQHIKPGRYTIPAGSGNWDLVRKLRSGDQDEMKLRFRTHWTLRDVANEIGDQLMLDSDDLLRKMEDPQFLSNYDVKPEEVRGLFIPNTYFVYWTLSADQLFKKLKGEYDNFWNSSRKEKAKAKGMTPAQVTTLASIVQAETYMADERPTVAGLYLNRIEDGIPLQADPTVIFATGDFTIKRVLKRHLETDSPYNTYKHKGLPPGPINNPEPSAIDGVLNAEDHKYIFMCAKADFSGYHNFARTLSEHNRNARAYQSALSKMQREKKKKAANSGS